MIPNHRGTPLVSRTPGSTRPVDTDGVVQSPVSGDTDRDLVTRGRPEISTYQEGSDSPTPVSTGTGSSLTGVTRSSTSRSSSRPSPTCPSGSSGRPATHCSGRSSCMTTKSCRSTPGGRRPGLSSSGPYRRWVLVDPHGTSDDGWVRHPSYPVPPIRPRRTTEPGVTTTPSVRFVRRATGQVLQTLRPVTLPTDSCTCVDRDGCPSRVGRPFYPVSTGGPPPRLDPSSPSGCRTDPEIFPGTPRRPVLPCRECRPPSPWSDPTYNSQALTLSLPLCPSLLHSSPTSPPITCPRYAGRGPGPTCIQTFHCPLGRLRLKLL